MTTHPAAWYPDPMGRFEHRYHDGTNWTDAVSTNGQPSTDPVHPPAQPVPPPPPTHVDSGDARLTVGREGRPDRVDRQVHGTGYRGAGIPTHVAGGSGSVFDEPILVVNQKAKLIELNNQYSVMDQHGTPIATVNQVGQSKAKKVARLLLDVDQYMTHKLEVTDRTGAVVLRITRPRKFIKSTVIVSDGHDREIGKIVQEKVFGKISFGLEADGRRVGAIKAENWRAWKFRIEDHTGNEVARITKTFEGVMKTMFTTADNYVVQIHSRQPEPLNSLIVASALSVDTALKQDSRGLN